MPTTEQFILEYLKEEILGTDVACDTETSIEGLGLDSYSTIQMVLALEEKTGKSLLENGLKQIHIQNVRTLAAFVVGIV